MLAYGCKALTPVVQTRSKLADIMNAGCDGFETDIRITSDGVYVLRHDGYVNGVNISTSTYAELLAADSELLTLDQMLSLQKEHHLIAVYESKILDQPHAHPIVDAIVSSGVELMDTFIEAYSFPGTPLFTDYNKAINVIWKGGTLSDEGIALAAESLTGVNSVLFTIDQSALPSFSNEWVEKIHALGLGLVADPITAGAVTTYAQYPFDQIWNSGISSAALAKMRDQYMGEKPEVDLGRFLTEIANSLRLKYGTTGKIRASQFARAISKI